jgi:hypothetical protein
MQNNHFGGEKLLTINRRMFIVGAAKFVVFHWYNYKIIFITNYRKQKSI